MLTIRLQRAGKKNRPEFRLILAEKTAAASKKFLEVLGNYNPHTKSFVVRNPERLNYWIAQHVELSPTVHNLLVSQNIISEKKVKSFTIPKKTAPTSTAESGVGAPIPTPTPGRDVGAASVGVEAAPEAPVAEAAAAVAEAPSAAPAEVASETPAEAPAEETQA